MSETTATPEVLWAQRSSSSDPAKNYIFLTIMVPDVAPADMKLDLTDTKLSFKGLSQTKKTTYAVDLEFYAEIDAKESKINHTARDIELVLRKKELKEEYWPRLLKESRKLHFVKTNFDKWVDEDEQDAAVDDEDYMAKMNAMGGDSGFGGIDFSKLGGAGGAGGFPGVDEGDEDDEDDDEELPGLADESAATESKKVEEVEEVK